MAYALVGLVALAVGIVLGMEAARRRFQQQRHAEWQSERDQELWSKVYTLEMQMAEKAAKK